MSLRKTEPSDSPGLSEVRIKCRERDNAASTKVDEINKSVLLYIAEKCPDRCPSCELDCNFNLWSGQPHKEAEDPPLPVNHSMGEGVYLECMNCGWEINVTPYHLF